MVHGIEYGKLAEGCKLGPGVEPLRAKLGEASRGWQLHCASATDVILVEGAGESISMTLIAMYWTSEFRKLNTTQGGFHDSQSRSMALRRTQSDDTAVFTDSAITSNFR